MFTYIVLKNFLWPIFHTSQNHTPLIYSRFCSVMRVSRAASSEDVKTSWAETGITQVSLLSPASHASSTLIYDIRLRQSVICKFSGNISFNSIHWCLRLTSLSDGGPQQKKKKRIYFPHTSKAFAGKSERRVDWSPNITNSPSNVRHSNDEKSERY